MRKIYTIICGLLLGNVLLANDTESLGVITDKDFAQVGVSKESVIKAKEIIKNSKNRYDYLILDRRSKELEINKCILEGVEKNWSKIEELTDQIGKIEADLLKERIKSQYEAQKHINQEQYLKAREIAIKRIEASRDNKSGSLSAKAEK